MVVRCTRNLTFTWFQRRACNINNLLYCKHQWLFIRFDLMTYKSLKDNFIVGPRILFIYGTLNSYKMGGFTSATNGTFSYY